MTEILKGAKPLREWARITGIPYNSLRKSVQSGDLPGYQFKKGGQIYVTPDAMEVFVEQAKVRPVHDTPSE